MKLIAAISIILLNFYPTISLLLFLLLIGGM